MSVVSDRDKAKKMYIDSKGTIALIDIANELKRPSGTVRGWKSKYKWDEELNGTFQEKVERSSKKENTLHQEEKKETKYKNKVIKEVVTNDELTDKQQLFCIYYLKYFNATKAYIKAYKGDYATANASGPRMLVNVSIKKEIERLKQERMNDIYLESKDIMQKYIDIAFSDITDFLIFGTEEVIEYEKGKPKYDEETGKVKTYKRNYLRFKEYTEVDGTIISEVSQGKDGVKIKLNDKMKALDWLAKNLAADTNLDNELLKARIDREKANTQLLQIELNKATGEDKDIENIQNFIKATNPNIDELFGDKNE